MKPVFKSFVDEEEITAPKSGWTPIQQQIIIEDFNKDKKYWELFKANMHI